MNSKGHQQIAHWFKQRDWQPFPYQTETWQAVLNGKNGLLNAPTGSGKTFALFMPALIRWINHHPETYKELADNGLQLLWITPLQALARDLQQAMQQVVEDLEIPWQVKRRTGDVSSYQKQQLKKQMPEVLITTPESMHIMMAQKGYPRYFQNLSCVVIDEWHELLGSKRGTQAELALSRLRGMKDELQVWGISATIGNMKQARDVLLGPQNNERNAVTITANVEKKLEVKSVLPDDVEEFPWSGHLGTKLLHKVIPVLEQSGSTLVFCNTRSQTEVWFQKLLEAKPKWAGNMALHHGSLSAKIRSWVEESLHERFMKVVVCTSSLDLGVDFAPVETVVQVGSPKGVARFMQRAGRSGHQPGATSRIFFVPTNALELIEAAALKTAAKAKTGVESREPVLKPYDVLLQYLMTLGVSDGFNPDQTFQELKQTFAYQTLNEKEWDWILNFLTTGGESLNRYDEYSKMHEAVDGTVTDEELQSIQPILDIQSDWSALPDDDELLIEKIFSREGCHLFFYPFEGRFVHEGMSALIAWRISQLLPITFSIAMNDYGFELLSDKDIPIEKALKTDLFTYKNLVEDIFSSLNDTEMAKHRFRKICQISGLIFQGFPGQKKANRHLQMSSGLFFDVFAEHEPDNLLLQQAYDEVLSRQLDEARLRKALKSIQSQKITLKNPERFTPLAFPIMVDRLRERLSSEKLIDRVQRMQVQLGKHV